VTQESSIYLFPDIASASLAFDCTVSACNPLATRSSSQRQPPPALTTFRRDSRKISRAYAWIRKIKARSPPLRSIVPVPSGPVAPSINCIGKESQGRRYKLSHDRAIYRPIQGYRAPRQPSNDLRRLARMTSLAKLQRRITTRECVGASDTDEVVTLNGRGGGGGREWEDKEEEDTGPLGDFDASVFSDYLALISMLVFFDLISCHCLLLHSA
jgi:hypothetical protein